MLFCDIDLLDADFAIKHHQWVGVRDGRIAYIGSVPPAPDEAATFGENYDGTGRLLMPALYNAHAHAPMTLLRGYAENLPLQRWLEEKCFPFEAKMTAEDCYWGTVLACAEMARFGVVSFSDMYYATEERARAVLEAGMKANMCEGLVAFEEKPYAEYPICAQMEADIAELEEEETGLTVDRTVSSSQEESQRIKDVLALHGEYLDENIQSLERYTDTWIYGGQNANFLSILFILAFFISIVLIQRARKN